MVHSKRKNMTLATKSNSHQVDHISSDTYNEPSPKKLKFENQTSEAVGFSGKPILHGKEYAELKKMLKEKEKFKKSQPKFKLLDGGKAASLLGDADRVPLYLCDIQHLLMWTQLGHMAPYEISRWCKLEKFNKVKHTNVLIVENLSLYHYLSYESLFVSLKDKFPFQVEVLTPNAYKGDLIQDIATVPLTTVAAKKFMDKYGTLDEAVVKSPELFDRIRNLFPVEEEKPVDKSLPKGNKFPRTHLLLSGWQMVEENYPLPIKALMDKKYAGYVLSHDSYADVTPSSPMFGIDCEMCITSIGDSELTRVSVVNEKDEVVYEQLVKPDNRITDYVTRFSGITHKMMINVTKKLKDVQNDLRKLLPPDAILVGQSLGNDLHALKLMHPYNIDTSVIYNLTGERQRKTKLQVLAKRFLNENIQRGGKGHCSVEDSLASLRLVKLKLTKHLYYGDAVMGDITSHIQQFAELGTPNYATSLLKQCTKLTRNASVVSLEENTKKYCYFTHKEVAVKETEVIKFFSETSNKRIIQTFYNNINKFSLNIAHTSFKEEEIEADAAKVCKKVNKWIENLYFKTEPPSLCVVIFGGCNPSGNGCCFIANKEVIAPNDE